MTIATVNASAFLAHCAAPTSRFQGTALPIGSGTLAPTGWTKRRFATDPRTPLLRTSMT